MPQHAFTELFFQRLTKYSIATRMTSYLVVMAVKDHVLVMCLLILLPANCLKRQYFAVYHPIELIQSIFCMLIFDDHFCNEQRYEATYNV